MNLTILHGDVREKVAEIPSASVQFVVTSPPYWGLRSYLRKDDPLKARDDRRGVIGTWAEGGLGRVEQGLSAAHRAANEYHAGI